MSEPRIFLLLLFILRLREMYERSHRRVEHGCFGRQKATLTAGPQRLEPFTREISDGFDYQASVVAFHVNILVRRSMTDAQCCLLLPLERLSGPKVARTSSFDRMLGVFTTRCNSLAWI